MDESSTTRQNKTIRNVLVTSTVMDDGTSLCIISLFLLSFSCLQVVTLGASSNSGSEGCFRDANCEMGEFCHFPSRSCVPCLQSECVNKWKRVVGWSLCIKSQDECGGCLPGYYAHHGHCQPEAESTTTPGKSKSANGEDLGFSVQYTSTLVMLSAFILLIAAIPPFFAYFCLHKISCFSRRGERTNEKGRLIRDGDIESPPPYNPHAPTESLLRLDQNMNHRSPFQWSSSPVPAGQATHESPPVMAMAFNSGRFPTITEVETDGGDLEDPNRLETEPNPSTGGEEMEITPSEEAPSDLSRNVAPDELVDSAASLGINFESRLEENESIRDNDFVVLPNEGANEPPFLQVRVGLLLRLASILIPSLQPSSPTVAHTVLLDESRFDLSSVGVSSSNDDSRVGVDAVVDVNPADGIVPTLDHLFSHDEEV